MVHMPYEPLQDPKLKKDHFRVTATPTTPDEERQGEDTVTKQFEERSSEIELELGIEYTLTVSTCYTDANGNGACYFPSKAEPTSITTPKIEKGMNVL